MPTSTILVQLINWINYRGLNDTIYANKLIVPPALRRIGKKILGSEGEQGTTDNDMNTHKDLGISLLVEPYLTSSTAWFLQGPDHGLLSNFGMYPTAFSYAEDSSRSIVHGVEFDFLVGPEYPDGMAGTSGA